MALIDEISTLTEFNDMKEYMKDPDLDEALDLITKLIAKPDVPSMKAMELIVKLQALSAKFAMLARFYTSFEKGEAATKKKNVYYSAADAIDKLAAAVKYAAKTTY